MRSLLVEVSDEDIIIAVGDETLRMSFQECHDLTILMIAYDVIKDMGGTGIVMEDGMFRVTGDPEAVLRIMTKIAGGGSAKSEEDLQ